MELTLEQNSELIRNYCQTSFVDRGMIADFAVHDDNNGNPHAHVLLTMRFTSQHSIRAKCVEPAASIFIADGKRRALPLTDSAEIGYIYLFSHCQPTRHHIGYLLSLLFAD